MFPMRNDNDTYSAGERTLVSIHSNDTNERFFRNTRIFSNANNKTREMISF